MKMKKTVVTVLLFTAVICRAFAQAAEPETSLDYVPDKYFYINLDVNMPVGNTEWLDATTARGIKGGYRQFITRSLSAGVDVAWANYHQYFPRKTFENPSGALTTDYFNYLTSLSITLSAQYNFPLKSEIFYPYLGVGLGAMGNEYTTYYNI